MNERAEWARLCAETDDTRKLAETLLEKALTEDSAAWMEILLEMLGELPPEVFKCKISQAKETPSL